MFLPHVVIVLFGNASPSDGFSAGQFPCYAALEQQGTTFSAWTSNPIGSHSNYQLIFGEYPFRNGNRAGFSFFQVQGPSSFPTPSLDRSKATLPQSARVNGIRTAFFGKLNVGRHDDLLDPLTGDRNGYTPYLLGFDDAKAIIGSNVNSAPSVGNPGSSYTDWLRWDDGHSQLETQWCDEAIGDAWLAWFALHQLEETFSVVSFQAAHGPLSGFPPASSLPAGYTTAATQQAHLMAMDFQLGRIVSQLDLSTDHILVFATTGSGVKSVKDDRILCPAVAAGPSWPAGEIAAIATPRDIWAQMAGVLGLSSPLGPDCQAAPASYAYCNWQGNLCVRTTTEKLIQLPSGVQEFYDLTTDPNEASPQNPDTVPNQALIAELRAWLSNP